MPSCRQSRQPKSWPSAFSPGSIAPLDSVVGSTVRLLKPCWTRVPDSSLPCRASGNRGIDRQDIRRRQIQRRRRAAMGFKELPSRNELRDYNHAVAGHAGTMCDAQGELFIKPCTQSEIDFYQSASRRHPEFAELMPRFMGSLLLSDPCADGIDDAVAGVISEVGNIEMTKEQIVATVAEQIANAPMQQESGDDATWIPNRGRKINTDKAVVLENATYGFKHANILDIKLGIRLWADDAPAEKKRRFDKISSETTHGSLGFRIAGMRVYRGSDDSTELDEEGYKVYDKDYGRLLVKEENVADELAKFIFNEAAGIDKELGQAVCSAFVRDLARVRDVLSRHESRMYSTSLLFVFEGDGQALTAAIEENNSLTDLINERASSKHRTTKRIDSGIGLEDDVDSDADDEDDELDSLESSLPQIYTLKLIDFAHAQWVPGSGPDENILTGVRNLERIFEKLAGSDEGIK